MKFEDYYLERLGAGAFTAGVFAGALFGLLALVSLLLGEFGYLDYFRLGVSFVMVAVATLVYFYCVSMERVVVYLIELLSFVYLLSVPLFVVFARSHGVELSGGFSVSLSIGLFLHYAILRLTTFKSVTIGISASVLGVLLVYRELNVEAVRGCVYIATVNLMGFTLCMVAEARERMLFCSRVEIRRVWERLGSLRKQFLVEKKEDRVWVASIAHELGQPLISARVATIQALDDVEDQSQVAIRLLRSACESIEEVEAGFARIVERIRKSSDLIGVRVRWVNLSVLIESAIKGIEVQWPQVRSSLVFEGNIHEWMLYTDSFLMTRVLRNYIENAIKYSPRDRRLVRIRILRGDTDSDLVLRVVNRSGRAGYIDGILLRPIDDQPKIGKGLKVGMEIAHHFVKALPGHFLRTKLKLGFGSVVEVKVVRGLSSLVGLRAQDLYERGDRQFRFFVDSIELRLIVARMASSYGAPIVISETLHFHDWLGRDLFQSAEDFEDVCIVEVPVIMVSAVEYFGMDLYDFMMRAGRYIFLAAGRLDKSFDALGVSVNTTSGHAAIVDQLEELLFEVKSS